MNFNVIIIKVKNENFSSSLISKLFALDEKKKKSQRVKRK